MLYYKLILQINIIISMKSIAIKKSFLLLLLFVLIVAFISEILHSTFLTSTEDSKSSTRKLIIESGVETNAATTNNAISSSNHLIAIKKTGIASYDFYNKKTGDIFNPTGFSYIRLNTLAKNSHSTFNPGHYNPNTANVALKSISDLKFNLIRVVINAEELITSGAQVSEQYTSNVADFISKASSHNLQVMIVLTLFLDESHYPSNTNPSHFQGANWLIMTDEALNYRKEFLKNFVSSLNKKVSKEYIFSYDLGEFALDKNLPPLNLPIGTSIKTTLGTFRISKNDDIITKHYSNFLTQMANAIREVDPDVLVGVDAFHDSHPHIGSKTHNTSILFKSINEGGPNIDYVGLQMYLPIADTQNFTFKQFLDTFGVIKNSVRPVILEEYGDTKTKTPNIDIAIKRLKDWTYYARDDHNLKGNILWTYDTNENSTEGNQYWLGTDGNLKIAKALSPINLPLTNLALNKKVSATNQLATDPSHYAIDNNPDTKWSSGKFSPQSLLIFKMNII